MLNYARQTLKRVPSFQEILQGKMGSAKEEMYVHRLPTLHPSGARPDNATVLSMCSLSVLVRPVSEQQSACTRLYVQQTPASGGASANNRRTAPHG